MRARILALNRLVLLSESSIFFRIFLKIFRAVLTAKGVFLTFVLYIDWLTHISTDFVAGNRTNSVHRFNLGRRGGFLAISDLTQTLTLQWRIRTAQVSRN